jgi:methionyl-tRNA synthetase
MCGFDVAHFIGTDRHGVNLEPSDDGTGAARAASLEQDCKKFEELLSLVDVHCTHFQHTYSPEHILAVETLLRRTMRRSQLAIYEQRYQGRYCPHDQINVSESAEPANCAVCGRAAVLISEDRHFFRLSAFQGRLMALYKYHPEFIQPQFRLDEIKSLVARGLKDVPISRQSAVRGIPWPDDPGRVVYGRCIELASYLSGIGFGEGGYGSEEFKRYWPPNLHVIGKESLELHAIHWPAFLMAADLPVPRHIFAHGALSFEKQETGTTLFDEATARGLGSDAVRYYLLRAVAYGEDAHVSCDGLVTRYNADLVDGLGNLANRILTLVARYCDARIPSRSVFPGAGYALKIASGDVRAEVRFSFDHHKFSEAIDKIWSLITAIDRLLTDNDPCQLANDPGEKRRLADVLHDACQGLSLLALLLHPFLPRATDAIWRSLGQTTRLEDQTVDESPWGCLMSGTPIGKLEALFPRIHNLESVASLRPGIRVHPSD